MIFHRLRYQLLTLSLNIPRMKCQKDKGMIFKQMIFRHELTNLPAFLISSLDQETFGQQAKASS